MLMNLMLFYADAKAVREVGNSKNVRHFAGDCDVQYTQILEVRNEYLCPVSC